MAGRARGRETVGDLLRSMALLLVGVVAVVAMVPHPTHHRITAVDLGRPIRALAAVRGVAVSVPVPPAGWTATAVSTAVPGPHQPLAALAVRYYVPSVEATVLLLQTTARPDVVLARVVGAGSLVGSEVVAGLTYQRFHTASGQDALLRTHRGLTTVITGTADVLTMRALAARLR